MQSYFYLLLFIPLSESCRFSSYDQVDVSAHTGASVLLPCSCRHPQKSVTDPMWTFRRKNTVLPFTKINTDDKTNQFYFRAQLFNIQSPGNLSLVISQLTEADAGLYRCLVGHHERFVILTVTELKTLHSIKATDKHCPVPTSPSSTSSSDVSESAKPQLIRVCLK